MKQKIDWWFWGILVFFLLALLLSVGCNILQPISKIPESIIPSSPAQQMWKVVAKSNWVVTLCLLGFGGGVFAYANGMTKLGLSVIFSCVATLFFGLAVHRFPTWMAVFGLIGAIAAASASILMKHRAIIEVIKGGQTFKKEFEHDAEEFNKKQKQEQSPITQKLVKKIKGNLKLEGKM